MPTVTYTVFDGEIVSENRAGVERDYVPDPLGSTVALLDSNQAITDTWEYWPYGEVRTRTGANETPFQWVGVWGYYKTPGLTYVRARSYLQTIGQWTTTDAFWPYQPATRYAASTPVTLTDRTGEIIPIIIGGLIVLGLLGGCSKSKPKTKPKPPLGVPVDCVFLCSPLLGTGPGYLVCLEACHARKDMKEVRELLEKRSKQRFNSGNPKNDRDCFFGTKGGYGADDCTACCETLHGGEMNDSGKQGRCDCFCDMYFTNPNRDCSKEFPPYK